MREGTVSVFLSVSGFPLFCWAVSNDRIRGDVLLCWTLSLSFYVVFNSLTILIESAKAETQIVTGKVAELLRQWKEDKEKEGA